MSHHPKRRLLTIAHSYCVSVNRRLADELGRTGDWDVTAVGPSKFRGDFAWHTLSPDPREHCRTIAVPVRFARRVHLMTYGAELASLLREPWDLVHCWEEPYVASAAQIAAHVRPDVPLVLATFQNISKRYPPPFSWFERYSLRRANGVIAFGRTVLDTVSPRLPSGMKTAVISPGVDTTRFAPDRSAGNCVRETLGWTGDTPVIGFLGRLVPEKGIAVLTAALDRLAGPWRALIVGTGPLERELRTWAGTYGTRVAIVSSVTHDDVPRWLNAMDILCAPSLTTPRWREQFGRMLIEAFACGVPVVASDSGEIPYVVGNAGVIVSEGNIADWASTLARLIADAGFRADLGRRGRERAEAVFDWSVVARQHSAFFEEVSARSVTERGCAA